mgnify:FL=1
MDNFEEYGESQAQYGLVLAYRDGVVIVVDSGAYDDLNYEIETYKNICNGMEVKIIPYDENAYNVFKDDTIRMQERLLQFFI